MIEYINRDDAIHDLLSPSITTDAVTITNIAAALIRIPVADVRENVHGEWIDTGSGEECSVCHEIQYGYDSGRRFCANCGAQMDGAAEGG